MKSPIRFRRTFDASTAAGWRRCRGRLAHVLVPALLAFLAVCNCQATAGAEQLVKRFKETDESFVNPGQGWMVMQRLPGRDGRFPYSVAYFRLNWEEIEPAEGQFNWHPIDEAIQAWAARGIHVAFRIMTANAHTKGYYCAPKWLFDEGCRWFEYREDGTDPTKGGSAITRLEPDYGDPLFLKKHGQTIQALAKHCDGNPGIEFIDIGSYGIWGEWHTPYAQPWPVRKQIMDMYLTGFRKTQLVSMSDGPALLRPRRAPRREGDRELPGALHRRPAGARPRRDHRPLILLQPHLPTDFL